MDEVAKATHLHGLPSTEGRPGLLRIDAAHMGVGGAGESAVELWKIEDEFRLLPSAGPWSYTLLLEPA
eukprot:CAMPEP_0204333250 /NCGR_PEP_ID=MMETSP0469-20131031/17073_1 /ASSEMBLY_ACC=CAM_ASM_000384 /TAXON_ID=2969 /ORGANISM="Oxyrrhis marina" /LENGTH=67 /DNA_ID=CAMNT_0051316555 /DNA_START=11 /DNA_END=214 /DNA_ORIENTATION=-